LHHLIDAVLDGLSVTRFVWYEAKLELPHLRDLRQPQGFAFQTLEGSDHPHWVLQVGFEGDLRRAARETLDQWSESARFPLFVQTGANLWAGRSDHPAVVLEKSPKVQASASHDDDGSVRLCPIGDLLPSLQHKVAHAVRFGWLEEAYQGVPFGLECLARTDVHARIGLKSVGINKVRVEAIRQRFSEACLS
jgi:hypothetical protein